MIFPEVGLLGLNSIFGSKKAPFFSIVDSSAVAGAGKVAEDPRVRIVPGKKFLQKFLEIHTIPGITQPT